MPFSWSEWQELPHKAWRSFTMEAVISLTSLFQDSPSPFLSEVLPFCPNLLTSCSSALCISLTVTCPTSHALQNSTSAYTFVLICSAPTLGCIPAPFLINPISHAPGFMASPMPFCMLTQVPRSLITFLLKSAAKLPSWAFLGPEADP